MNLTTGILIFVLVVAMCSVSYADFDNLIMKIDREWGARCDDTGRIEDTLAWAEQAYGEKPCYEAAWRAARACFWICDRTDDEQIDSKYGKRGYEWAEKAISLNPKAVEGYFYYAICLGEYSKGISIVTALLEGYGSKYEDALKKAIEIDPSFAQGGPYRAMGRYYYKLPTLKYDFERAEENYKKALEYGPDHPRTLFYMAQLYVKEKKYDKAQEVLKKLADIGECGPDSMADQTHFQKLGAELSTKIRDNQ